MISKWTRLGRRIVQTLFSPKLFGLPLLNRFRSWAYRKLFKTGRFAYIGSGLWISCPHGISGTLQIGDAVDLGDNAYIDYTGDVYIGDSVTISRQVSIYSHEHDFARLARRESGETIQCCTNIKKGAWLGDGAIILPGISVGEYSVIGAGSVVTHDVPAYTVVAGNPARIIRQLDRSEH